MGSKAALAISAGVDRLRLQASLDWLKEEGNHLLTIADDDYPQALLEIADPPLVLYLKGNRPREYVSAFSYPQVLQTIPGVHPVKLKPCLMQN